MAEGVGGAAAVREELPRLPGHGEHFTSVSTARLNASLLSIANKMEDVGVLVIIVDAVALPVIKMS